MAKEQQCVKVEQEYRDWRQDPIWYCVKTLYNNLTAAMKSELVRDEQTKLPITIHDTQKPADGVFQSGNTTVYYTYHSTYEEAARQIAAASV